MYPHKFLFKTPGEMPLNCHTSKLVIFTNIFDILEVDMSKISSSLFSLIWNTLFDKHPIHEIVIGLGACEIL